jgi:hypothetical protein
LAQPITTHGDLDAAAMDLSGEPLPDLFVYAAGTPNGAVLVYDHDHYTGGMGQVFGRALCHQ